MILFSFDFPVACAAKSRRVRTARYGLACRVALQDAFRQLDEERAGNAEEHEQEEGCCVGRNEMNDGFYEDDEESLVVW